MKKTNETCGVDHCDHPNGVQSFRSGVHTTRLDTYVCCNCGRSRTETWSSQKDPSHGPFAPPIMALEGTGRFQSRVRRAIHTAVVILLAMGGVGCGTFKVPPCLLDGSLCQPSPVPSPSGSPSPAPTASPTSSPSPVTSPTPSPAPSAVPTPSPAPSASPSASPTPAPTPTPTPRPSPTPNVALPPDPVPLRNEAKCKDLGEGWERAWAPGDVPLCVAPSLCPKSVCYVGEYGLTAELMQDDHCKPFTAGEIEYGFRQRFWAMTTEGFLANGAFARGQYDAYGRVYRQGEPPHRDREFREDSWTWMGWCPPAARMAPATPPSPPPPPTDPDEPDPPPQNGDLCPLPGRLKVALFTVNDRRIGAQNVWNITPMVPSTGDGGSCEWKRDKNTGKLPPECEAHHSCARDPDWPEISAYQNGPGFSHAAIEFSQGDPRNYMVHIATNTPEQYRNGEWQEAGYYEVCVTMPHLKFDRCTAGNIGTNGRAQRGNGSWPEDRGNKDVPK